jgi:hypothetical protein
MFARMAAYRKTLAARAATMRARERKSLDAELGVVRHLETLPSVLQVWHGIRIPDPNRPRGAGELDAVALTPFGIVALECKNWVGEVVMEDGDLVQLRRRARGKTSSVLPRLLKKAAHMKRMALSLYNDPAFEIVHVVVLPNHASRFSQECKDHPSIVKLAGLEAFIKRAFAKHDLLSDAQLAQYADFVERCGGWDSIAFAGGRSDNGDFDDAQLPLGWQRSEVKSVKIELHGGIIRTLFRGMHLNITTTAWNGEQASEILGARDLSLTHTIPWAPSGTDRKGTHPLAHLQSVTFGSKIPFTEAAAAFAVASTSAETKEGLSTVDEASSNRSEAESLKTLYQRFQPGDAVTGTVIRHLQDDSGATYALLVELVARQVKGILYMDELNDVNPVFFDMFYGPEQPVDVVIARNDGNGRIKLKIDKEA